MIENISIANVSSFGAESQEFGPLREVNFTYGANGSGKTTISRIIAGEEGFSHCPITWEGGTALEPFVYNRDFVERHFRQELKGIFTLGEADDAVLRRLEAATAERDDLQKNIQGKNRTLSGEDGNGGKKGELEALANVFSGQCWQLKVRYDADFEAASRAVSAPVPCRIARCRQRVAERISGAPAACHGLAPMAPNH